MNTLDVEDGVVAAAPQPAPGGVSSTAGVQQTADGPFAYPKLDARSSGSTATIVVKGGTDEPWLLVGHIGDARALLFKPSSEGGASGDAAAKDSGPSRGRGDSFYHEKKAGTPQTPAISGSVPDYLAAYTSSYGAYGSYGEEKQEEEPMYATLTQDHRPDTEQEKARIEAAGAEVRAFWVGSGTSVQKRGLFHKFYIKLERLFKRHFLLPGTLFKSTENIPLVHRYGPAHGPARVLPGGGAADVARAQHEPRLRRPRGALPGRHRHADCTILWRF